jgi:hypothetical protein
MRKFAKNNYIIISMNLLRRNQQLLQMQQVKRVRSGRLLQNIFSISSRYPFLSLMFVVSFGVFTNAAFETISYFWAQSSYTLLRLVTVDAVLIALMIGAFLKIWWRHRDFVKSVPLTQKKVLITLASDREDFKESPSYGVYKALTYQSRSVSSMLEEVVIVATEETSSQKMAVDLAKYIETDGRKATVENISIATNDVQGIKQQMANILNDYLSNNYKSYEVVADYTGGTKMMSVALYDVSEQKLVAQIYFTQAMTVNHSKYAAGR